MKLFCRRQAVGLAIVAAVLLSATTAFASHFRGSTLNWQHNTDTATHYKFTVTYTAGLRWSFPYQGNTVCGFTPAGGAATGAGACPVVGTTFTNAVLGNIAFLNPSNGAPMQVRLGTDTSPFVTVKDFAATVTKIVPAQDLMYVTYSFVVFVPKTSVLPRVRWELSARLSNLLEGNNDTTWRVESVLNLNGTQSPEAVMVATVPVKANVLNTLTIPTSTEPGTTVQLSIAPQVESGLNRTTPTNFTFSNVSPNTINFTPPQVGLYSVQLKATSFNANNQAVASAPFEFLLSATNCTVNCPSINMSSPTPTVTVEVGDTLSYPVTATAGNMTPTTVAIDSTPLPGSMTVTTVGVFPTVISTYHWTPTVNDLGAYPVCFQGVAGVTNSAPYCVVINAVVHNDPPIVSCSAPLTVPAGGITGALASVFATVSDPDMNGLTVSWKVDGAAAGFQNVPGASGDTAVELSHQFPIGVHSVLASVTDGFETVTCTTSVTVSKVAQSIIINTPPNVAFGTHSIVLTGTSSSGNGVTYQLVSGPATLAGSLLTITGLGTINLTASAAGNATYDPAGPQPFSINVIDTTAPAVTVPGPITAEATSPAGAIVVFASSATDNVDGAMAAACSPASGSAFVLGATLVNCTAADAAGNVGNASFTVTVQDTTAPSIDPSSNVNAEATSAAGAIVVFTNPNTMDLVSGPGTAICLPAAGSTFPFGTTTITCNAFDASSNSSSSTFTVTVADTTAPAIVIASPQVVIEPTSPSGAMLNYVMPTATDVVDGAVTVTCTPASGSQFALGNTQVNCSAPDAHGNIGSGSFSVTVVDRIAPVITGYSDVTMEATSPAGAPVMFAPLAADTVDGMVTVNCVPAAGSVFGIQQTQVTCHAADAAGNTAEAQFNVTVVDTVAPVIAAHVDVNAAATSAAGAIVNYSAPATSDVVDGNGLAVCLPAAGLFARGTTTVTCQATDAHGNAAIPTSFTVTVTNNAPTIAPLANVVTEATGNTGAAVTFASVGSDIEDGPLAGVCSPASGSVFAIGSTMVNCTVTDVAGASASNTFTITVRDTTAPVVTVASVTVPATAASGANVTFAASAIDIVDGALVVNCSRASGSLFPLGATVVTCTATDARGNTGSGSGTITVADGIAPVVTYTGNAGTYNVAQTVNITCSASDIGSGLASTTCANISGPAYTFALGVNTFSATATDHAGNVGSASTSFTVGVTSASLRQLVLMWVNNSGVANALVNKLDQADGAPNANARRGMVGAFENQLNGQTGKSITAAHAATILQLLHALYQ